MMEDWRVEKAKTDEPSDKWREEAVMKVAGLGVVDEKKW